MQTTEHPDNSISGLRRTSDPLALDLIVEVAPRPGRDPDQHIICSLQVIQMAGENR